ncbi:MFS general substrate transporter [Lojkania enalia]|uniref:MFS general substrate transporter n=1 Tax=Lojkania enalia TaxID=147567 RepID=A0A9P4K2R8_9PLEO|nr:MFS general substrate transporter [Didymosphaeria enalia]
MDPTAASKDDFSLSSREIGLKTEIHAESPKDEAQYPGGLALSLIMVALLLSMFLVALDMTIVATAIPRITDDFNRLDQVGWYGSGFFLTVATFQASWGKAYKYFPLKIAFFTSVIIFEVGSLICALAKDSPMLIVGRAIQGVGGAGIIGGCYVIIAFIVPLQKAPSYIGLLGAVFSLASVAGPLLGGVFTDKVSWRWCFYINLPIGGLALFLLAIFFHTPAAAKPAPATWVEVFLQMDPLGIVLILASLVCYMLALEWAGVHKGWSSADVVGTLVGWIVLTICFVISQLYQGERSMIVPAQLKRRLVWSGSFFIFFLNAANFLMIYYLPIYFQAIQGASPSSSGVRNLPYILASSLCTVAQGHLIRLFPHPHPFMVGGAVVFTVGAGLLYTLDIGSSTGKYVGYQILVGAGIGTAIQVPVISAQAKTPPADLSTATSIILFFQLISGALSVSAAQAIFTNRLIASIPKYMADIDPHSLIQLGATNLRQHFAGSQLLGVLHAYMDGLRASWALGIGLAGIAVLACALFPRGRLSPKPAK